MRALLDILAEEQRVVKIIMDLEEDIDDMKKELERAQDHENSSMRFSVGVDHMTQRLTETEFRLEAEQKYLARVREEISLYLKAVRGCDA